MMNNRHRRWLINQQLGKTAAQKRYLEAVRRENPDLKIQVFDPKEERAEHADSDQ